jgi:hypothetical protein
VAGCAWTPCDGYGSLLTAASAIDVKDDRWEVFGVFEVARVGDLDDNASLVGYCTAYTFTNPTRAVQPNAIRICQFVILPSFQRQGTMWASLPLSRVRSAHL